MATPNEKEDAEVYPVVILDPNGNDYTKGIDPEKPEQSVYTLMR